MKILVLQLARLGDIFLTWPTLRALKRTYPDSEIHLLVREKFAGATEGLNCVDRVWNLKTGSILEPAIKDQDEQASLERLSEWLKELRREGFTNIINLSFSPVSSYLTHYLAEAKAQVFGYTRFNDGFLAIPDDASAYFYGQVGVGRPNRVHLGEVFAAVAGVDLVTSDWHPPSLKQESQLAQSLSLPDSDYIAVQISASESHKDLGASKWAQILRKLDRSLGLPIVLVGAKHERIKAGEITDLCQPARVWSVVGETTVAELFLVLAAAKVLIGPDSVGQHVAALTATPVVNISIGAVNFWETGPRSAGSRVVFGVDESEISSDCVVEEVNACLSGKVTTQPSVARRTGDVIAGFEIQGAADDNFCWELVQSIYMEKPFPVVTDKLAFLGMQKLHSTCELALQQLSHIKENPRNAVALEILSQVDSVLSSIGSMAPKLRPLVSWFEVERLRIGPGALNDVLQSTESLFLKLRKVLEIYVLPASVSQTEEV